MKKLAILIVCCCATQANAGLLFYDGFEYGSTQALAPTNDTTGTPNPGQHNVTYNVDWRYAGAGGGTNAAPTIGSTGLVAPGFPASPGNSVLFDMTQIGSSRIQVTPSAISTGFVYWSAVLRVNAIGTLTSGANGMLLGGFNNTAGAGALPTAIGAVLRIRKDASLNQYYIGTAMNSGTGAANIQFDNATPHFENDTVFVVGAYEFVAGATNDKSYMWINPNSSTYGALSAPTPLLTSAPGLADSFTSLLTYNLRNINTVGAPTVQFDELRVGTDWASVTVPEPASVALLVMGCLLLGRVRRKA